MERRGARVRESKLKVYFGMRVVLARTGLTNGGDGMEL
jgi:hypothetical protein